MHQKQDYNKKVIIGPIQRKPVTNRFSISPVPTNKKGLSFMTPVSLYHRRNITSIIRTPFRSNSIRSSLFYASDSVKGYNPNNPSKDNQDTVFMHPYMDMDFSIFGVCDGHGLYGREISNFISTSLPMYLQGKPVSSKLFIDAVHSIDHELKKCAFDVSFSGSTLIFCCVQKDRLFTINVGDSRAILGKRGYIKWEFIQLSRDHKPDIPEESLRIRNAGGRVGASNSVGPQRVWMPDKNSPGLAMSRSLGDGMVHQIGVSSEPEVFERTLNEDDEFIVIGSDGLFEFMSNQEVATIAGENSGNPRAACEELIAMARARWAKVIVN